MTVLAFITAEIHFCPQRILDLYAEDLLESDIQIWGEINGPHRV